MKKIGIIGLQPRQFSDVYNICSASNLLLFDGKTIDEKTVTSFSNKVDHVLMLAEHTPKSVHRALSGEKLTVLYGHTGVSTVKKYIAEHFSDAIKHTNPPTDVRDMQSNPTEVYLPSNWRESWLAIGTTNYRYLPDDNVTIIDGSARYSHGAYKLIEAGQPGDVFRVVYNKIPTMEDDILRLNANRKRYSKILGYKIELHLFSRHIDLYITDLRSETGGHRHRNVVVTSRTAMLAHMRLKDPLPSVKTIMETATPTTSLVPPTETCLDPTITEQRNAAMPSVEELPHGNSDREFWKQIVILGMRNGVEAATAIHAANQALQSLRNIG